MAMKFPVKISFDFDEGEYVVFIDGIKGIEGHGPTEQEAIDNFYDQLNRKLED